MAQYKGKTKAKEKAGGKETPKVKARKKRNGNWDYYSLSFMLRTEMLGTCAEASIWETHVIERAKKAAKEANKLGTRLNKVLDKFKGTEITDQTQIVEVQGIIRSYAELTGKPVNVDLPDDLAQCLKIASEIEAEYHALLKKGDMVRATIFMKELVGNINGNGDGRNKIKYAASAPEGLSEDTLWPIISTHMILGNLKENLKIIVNNGDKSILSTKVSVGETLAMDVKAVEKFMVPSSDISRNEDGVRTLLERPLSFDDKGKKVTTISSSEYIPEEAEFGCILRVRATSPLTYDALYQLFDYGKNNGLGQWRGSGNKGSYFFELKKLKDYKEPIPKGWN